MARKLEKLLSSLVGCLIAGVFFAAYIGVMWGPPWVMLVSLGAVGLLAFGFVAYLAIANFGPLAPLANESKQRGQNDG
jgi:hypothetical protein